MPAWGWVVIFCGIALAGLVMLICYAVWLAHKTGDVLGELTVLGDRTGKILDLLSQIEMPQSGGLRVDSDVLGGPRHFGEARIVEDRADQFVRSQNRTSDVR